MSKPRVDLHLHSYFSDGELSPTAFMGECGEVGLKVSSYLPHEYLRGLTEFTKASEKFLVKTVSGVEVFCSFHDEEGALPLHCIAQKLDLLESVGSDFHSHGATKLDKVFSRDNYGIEADFSWVDGLRLVNLV